MDQCYIEPMAQFGTIEISICSGRAREVMSSAHEAGSGDRRSEVPFSDLTIIDEPEVALVRDLVAYWGRKRGDRFAPRRSDIDPTEIPTHLPLIHMMDALDAGADFGYRLIGTAIVEGLGRDNTGKRLSELYGDRPDVLRRFVSRFALVVKEKRPVFSRRRIWWLPDRSYRRFAGASLPLSADEAHRSCLAGPTYSDPAVRTEMVIYACRSVTTGKALGASKPYLSSRAVRYWLRSICAPPHRS